jgi:ring-1,2-phenylacetyl-CoA epoxidase subunit PaaE
MAGMSTFHKLTVSDIVRLTGSACAVEFSVPEELRDEYAFRPGQHLTLRRLTGDLEDRRTYSICSTPADLVGAGRLRIGVKQIPYGIFSGWLTGALQVGEVVEVMTPAGYFGPPGVGDPANDGRRIGCLAAGSGITPVLSVAASVLAAEPASEVLLVYGNRTTADVMFLEPLADLKNRYPGRFTLLHVLSGEPQLSDLLTGRIDPAKIATLLAGPASEVTEWYLCGPFGMVTAAREALVAGGVPEGRVHTELFYAGELPEPEPVDESRSDERSQVTVTLAGRTSTVGVAYSGASILDAVLAARPDAPYACKGGVCGTCRAKLISGEVRMSRNYALEPDEIAAGLVLACQSHPVTDEVELEFR